MIFKTIVFVWLLWLTWAIQGAIVLPKPYDVNKEITLRGLIDIIKRHKKMIDPRVELLIPPPPLNEDKQSLDI